jgi:hypothetical protein
MVITAGNFDPYIPDSVTESNSTMQVLELLMHKLFKGYNQLQVPQPTSS